jgi:peroxiredoxin
MSIKKIILASILIASVLPSFIRAQSFNYEIKGEIKGLKSDTLEFGILQGEKDTAIKVVAVNDKFYYKATANANYVVFAQVTNKRRNGDFTFFLDKGTLIISGDINAMDDVKVTGTPINDEYAAGTKTEFSFYKQRDSIYKIANGLDKNGEEYKRLMTNVDSVMESLQTFRVKYIEQHPASMFGAMQLYVMQDNIPVAQLEKLYKSLQAPAKDLVMLKNIPSRIEAKKASETGKIAPGFAMKDANGKLINLADYKGKYVLLDFWASWCVPCRQESPGLVKAYQKFKGKPFEIISVSSDVKEPSWRKAIKDDKLDGWVHICDFKGLNNQIAIEYGVQPIPDNFLIDPDGKIIARHLFGEELEQKLGTLFGNN